MTKKELENSDFIGARIDPELKKKFQEAAEKDERSLSNALIVAVRDFIQKVTGKRP